MNPSKLTGEEIREWRIATGWSQEEAAAELGISKSSLRNYERGSRPDKDDGAVEVPKLLDWALSAVNARLRPFSEMLARGKKK